MLSYLPGKCCENHAWNPADVRSIFSQLFSNMDQDLCRMSVWCLEILTKVIAPLFIEQFTNTSGHQLAMNSPWIYPWIHYNCPIESPFHIRFCLKMQRCEKSWSDSRCTALSITILWSERSELEGRCFCRGFPVFQVTRSGCSWNVADCCSICVFYLFYLYCCDSNPRLDGRCSVLEVELRTYVSTNGHTCIACTGNMRDYCWIFLNQEALNGDLTFLSTQWSLMRSRTLRDELASSSNAHDQLEEDVAQFCLWEVAMLCFSRTF